MASRNKNGDPAEISLNKNMTFIEQNQKDEFEETINKKQPLYKRILRNKIVQGIFILLIFSAGIIPLIYWLAYDNQDWYKTKPYTCVIDPGYRVPCVGFNVTQVVCHEANCCYDEKTLECYHTAPAQYFYSVGADGVMYGPSLEKTPFGKPSVKQMVIHYDDTEEGLQVSLMDASVRRLAKVSENYDFKIYDKKLAIEVFRKPSNERILSTGFGPLVASNDYWEWTVLLSTQYLFGLGQLIIDGNATVSRVFYKNEKDHYIVPAFLAYTNGSFHGMVVEHDGPLEVTVLPSKLIVLRSLVGRKITLNLFPGPTPRDVLFQMRKFQFTKPDDWLFEAHICRGGNVANLQNAIEEYKNLKQSGSTQINYGIDCFHENAVMMMIKEASPTVLEELKDLIKEIKDKGKKFSLAVTPHVPFGENELYKKAEELDVLYKNKSGKVYIGKYKNIDVAFLDVSSQNIDNWLSELSNFISQTIDANHIDAIVLLDNWPAEDTYNMPTESAFSYINENITAAMSHTIPWNLKTSQSKDHMFVHNKYGEDFLESIKRITPNKPILTSTYNYGMNNPVISRNINTTWTDFKATLVGNLFHGYFSHPLIASPVCGTKHFKTPQEEKICLRWYFMAASMPLFYASNDWPEGESGHGAAVAKNVVDKRRELVHYFKHFINNEEPATRPMFYDYYDDVATFVLDEQYMIGDVLLSCLPFYPTSTLKVYLPKGDEWYEFWGGSFIEKTGWITMNIIETDWPIFMKAGSIVPLRTTEATEEVFSLIAAFKCMKTKEVDMETCTSEGVLRYNNEILDIFLEDSVLTLRNIVKVKSEINCSEQINPRFIKSVKILTKKGTQFHDVNIDLCQKENEYTENLSGN